MLSNPPPLSQYWATLRCSHGADDTLFGLTVTKSSAGSCGESGRCSQERRAELAVLPVSFTSSTTEMVDELHYPAIDRVMSMMQARLLEHESNKEQSAGTAQRNRETHHQVTVLSQTTQAPHSSAHNCYKDVRNPFYLDVNENPEPPQPQHPHRVAAVLTSLRDLCVSEANKTYLAQPSRKRHNLTAKKQVSGRVVELLRKYYHRYLVDRVFHCWQCCHRLRKSTRAKLEVQLSVHHGCSPCKVLVGTKESTAIVHKWGRMRLAVRWDRRRVLRGVLLRWLGYVDTARSESIPFEERMLALDTES